MNGKFEVDVASGVEEALLKMTQKRYDAVISDYEMPDQNGLSFLKMLREQQNDVPFVLFTGKGREDVAIKALNLGSDAYINKSGDPETVYGELSDVLTKSIERKKSKKLLADSEFKYRKLIGGLLQGLLIAQGPKSRIIFANPAMEKITGFSIQELISLAPNEIAKMIHPEDRELFFDRFSKRLSGAEIESFYEFRGIRRDGSIIWLQACSSLIEYNGQPAVQGVFLDITERKKTEEALAESEEKFRKAFLTSPDAVYIGTLVEGKILEINERFEEVFGYTRQESIGKTSLELGLWANPSDREKIVSKLRSDGKVRNLEISGVRKNGQIFPLQISISVVQAVNQQLILGVIRDISSYKQAEVALRESETTYRNLINGMCDTAWVVDFEGNFVDVNEAAVKALGYSREELLSLGIKDVDKYLSPEQAINIMNSVPAVGAQVFETVHTAKDGTKTPVEISASLITFRGKQVVLGIARNITERKRAEEKLRESEAKYRSIFNNSEAGMFRTRLDGSEILDCNAKFLRIFNRTRDEVIGKPSIIHWADPNERQEMVRILQAKGHINDFECKMLNKQGEVKTCLTSLKLYLEQRILEGSIIDISERKRAEDELKKSQHFVEKILNTTPTLIYIYDLTQHCNVYANREILAFLGYTNEQIHTMGSTLFSQILHPDDAERVANHHLRLSKAGDNERFELEYRMKHSDGEWRWLHSIDIPFSRTQNGDVTQILGSAEDVTKRKKAEEALADSEAKYRALVDNADDSILLTDLNGRSIYRNPAYFKSLGLKEDEVETDGFGRVHPEDLPAIKEKMVRLIKTGSETSEYRIKHQNGTWVYRFAKSTLIYNNRHEPYAILAIIRDVTENKKAEQTLRDSEQKYQRQFEEAERLKNHLQQSALEWERTFDSISDCILVLDKDLRIIKINKATLNALNNDKKDFVGKKCHEVLHGKDDVLSGCPCGEILKTQTAISKELLDLQTGKCSLVSAFPIFDEKEQFMGVVHIHRDITDLKKQKTLTLNAQENLALALKQSELLNEKLNIVGAFARHDIRNKLAVINGNVYLAKKTAKDNPALMAKLDQIDIASHNIVGILDFSKDYESLGSKALSQMNVGKAFDDTALAFSDLKGIKIKNECFDFRVMADDMLTTIFHNLIENSLKYGEKATQIKVYIQTNGDGSSTIVYEDDGVGLDDATKQRLFEKGVGKGTGYGLYLIKRTCDLYRWTVKETGERGKGVRFELSIPNKTAGENVNVTGS